MDMQLYNELLRAAGDDAALDRFSAVCAEELSRAGEPWAQGASCVVLNDRGGTRAWLAGFAAHVRWFTARQPLMLWVSLPDPAFNPQPWCMQVQALAAPRPEPTEPLDRDLPVMTRYWRLDRLRVDWPEQPLLGLEPLGACFTAWTEAGRPAARPFDVALALAVARYLRHLRDALDHGDEGVEVCVAVQGSDEPQLVARLRG
jgi:hypothetical protein